MGAGEPLHVALVASWFLKYAAAQAVGLRAADAEVALVCRDRLEEFDGSRAEWGVALERARSAGCEILVLPGRIRSLPSYFELARIHRRLARWRPDVLHAHENNDPRLLSLAWRRRLVVTVHDPVPHLGDPPQGRIADLVDATWRKRADALVVHGRGLVPLVSPDDRLVAVIPHGLDLAPAPVPPPRDRVVLLFGRLEPYKGIDVLVRAMEIVWEDRPEIVLEIVGAGASAGTVPRHERIRHQTGYVPEDDVPALFERASLVALPYLTGSQSGVGSQALARGIPLIVSDVGALPELVPDRRFVVPPGDAPALAAAILEHVDHDFALRHRIHADARARFSWESVGRQALELYRHIRAEPRA